MAVRLAATPRAACCQSIDPELNRSRMNPAAVALRLTGTKTQNSPPRIPHCGRRYLRPWDRSRDCHRSLTWATLLAYRSSSLPARTRPGLEMMPGSQDSGEVIYLRASAFLRIDSAILLPQEVTAHQDIHRCVIVRQQWRFRTPSLQQLPDLGLRKHMG